MKDANDWLDKVREHWDRCDGLVGDDREFWQDCVLNVFDDIYASILDTCHTTLVAKPWYANKYPFIRDDMKVIEGRLIAEEPIAKNWHNQYNAKVYRGLMAFKDMMGEEQGRPFPQHGAPKPVVKKRTKPTVDEVLAQADKLSVMVKELFD